MANVFQQENNLKICILNNLDKLNQSLTAYFISAQRTFKPVVHNVKTTGIEQKVGYEQNPISSQNSNQKLNLESNIVKPLTKIDWYNEMAVDQEKVKKTFLASI